MISKNESFDYLIVGCGFAGLFFSHQLIKNNKSFLIYDHFEKPSASYISAGVYNPVVLKRFTNVWNSYSQIINLINEINELELLLNNKFLYQTPILRLFNDENEINTWINKAYGFELDVFLSKKIKKLNYPIKIKHAGKVNLSGRIDASLLIDSFKIKYKNQIIKDKFEHNSLIFSNDKFEYKGLFFNKIIFCEGFDVLKNPWFNFLPYSSDKGECLNINFPNNTNIFDKYILKNKYFLFKKNDYFYLGGTDNYTDYQDNKTNKSRDELIKDFNKIFDYRIEIKNHFAAIRPTTHDRRPYLGKHPKIDNMFIFNGLGTRGLMLGSFFSKQFFDYIEFNIQLPKEVDIQRIKHLNDKLP